MTINDDHNELLKSVSRSFYLSMRFLPAGMREPVSLGYLLARLTDTVADAEGIATARRMELLDAIRLLIQGQHERVEGLEKLADSLDHPGEAELLRQQTQLFSWYQQIDQANRDHLSEVILTIIHGQQWDSEFFVDGSVTACPDAEELLRYTYWVAGCVGEFWTKVGFTNLGEGFAHPDEASDMLVSGRKLGQALQLVNILRDLHEDLPAGRCYLPGDELKQAGWSGEQTPSPHEVDPVFRHWKETCRGFLKQSDGYIRAVRDGRVRFCTRLPRLIAEKTLNALESAGTDRVIEERIRVSRRDVWVGMLEAWLF